MSISRTHTMLATLAVAFAVSSAPAQQPGAPPPQGRRHGPPPIALQACAGGAEGDACSCTGRYGERIAGTCTSFGEQIACLPADAPPPPPAGEE